MTACLNRRWLAASLVAAFALVISPAAQAQEERQQPQDSAARGTDMLTQSGVGNAAQSAKFAYGSGERDLKRAAKLTDKLGELEGKKRDAAVKKIDKAYESAQGSFREALSMDPKMIEAYVGLGAAFRATGMYRESLQAVTQGLRVDSANGELFAGWAESLMGLNRLGDATQAHAQLLETNPAWAETLMGVIKVWLDERRADPGELDPADVEKMAVWIAEQEGVAG